jgi:hypothetical protein
MYLSSRRYLTVTRFPAYLQPTVRLLPEPRPANSPPPVEIPVGHGGVARIGALQIDAVGIRVDRAVQDSALMCALAQHRLLDGVCVAVALLHHPSDLETWRRRARQTVDRADLRLERLALPALVPRPVNKNAQPRPLHRRRVIRAEIGAPEPSPHLRVLPLHRPFLRPDARFVLVDVLDRARPQFLLVWNRKRERGWLGGGDAHFCAR